jgi:hypothetical protein
VEPTAAPEVRFRRPRSRIVWTLVIAGIVLGGLGFTMTAVKAFGPFFKPAFDVPGESLESLGAGRYMVFERNGSNTDLGPVHFSQSGFTHVDAQDVTVEGPDGLPVPVRRTSANETLTQGSSIYTGVAEFNAPKSGRYRVSVQGQSGEVIVGREMLDALRSGLGWILLAIVGFVLLVAGLIVAVARAFIHPAPDPRRGPAVQH